MGRARPSGGAPGSSGPLRPRPRGAPRALLHPLIAKFVCRLGRTLSGVAAAGPSPSLASRRAHPG
eukprot:2027579-Alexandrium_andersonii.AAC.1